MTTTRTTGSAADTASGIAAVLTGLGLVTFALFPLVIPILILTAVFTAPLALIGVIVALPIVILVGVVLAIRAMWRPLRRRRAVPTPST